MKVMINSVHFKADQKLDLFASKQSKSFEESIDTSIDALKKQLEKYKGKSAK